MTLAHYALIVTMSLLFGIGTWMMMYENSKANETLMYMAFAITVVGLLVIFFER